MKLKVLKKERKRRKRKQEKHKRQREADHKRRIEQRVKEREERRQVEAANRTVSVDIQAGYSKFTSKSTNAKAVRLKEAVKEINSYQIVRTEKHLGSGTYGSCYLANYRVLNMV